MKSYFKLFIGILSLVSFQAFAQSSLQLDMSTASVTKSASGRIVISGVGVGGSLYDAQLQWDPYNLRFDLIPETIVSTSGNERVCNLGTVGLSYSFYKLNVSLTTNKDARSITWKMTLVTAYNNSYHEATQFFGTTETTTGFPPVLVQNGRDVSTTWNAINVNSNTALFSKATSSESQSWNTIPSGSSREVVMTNIPTYIDLSAPLSKVWWDNQEYACL